MERLPRDLLMCIRASSLARKAAINLGAEPLSRIAAQVCMARKQKPEEEEEMQSWEDNKGGRDEWVVMSMRCGIIGRGLSSPAKSKGLGPDDRLARVSFFRLARVSLLD